MACVFQLAGEAGWFFLLLQHLRRSFCLREQITTLWLLQSATKQLRLGQRKPIDPHMLFNLLIDRFPHFFCVACRHTVFFTGSIHEDFRCKPSVSGAAEGAGPQASRFSKQYTGLPKIFV